MKCITTVQYCVLFNGERLEKFSPQRGIRLGVPLSPYLSILVADVLSKLIKRKLAGGRLKGLRIKRRCPVLSNLFFADDAI